MTTIINGSSPSITFSDSTTQASAGLTAASPTIASGVLTFPDASTQSTGTSGNFAFNSGYGSATTVYGCRAWVNFDSSSGSSCTIRGSGGVSSVTYVSTGRYTVNFSFTMPDTNYTMVGTGRCYAGTTNAGCIVTVRTTDSGVGGMTTTSCGVISINLTSGGAGAESNTPFVGVAFFR